MERESPRVDRRGLLQGTLASAAGLAVAPDLLAAEKEPAPNRKLNGRIKQSICLWCFSAGGEKWDLDTTCGVANELGCVSIELLRPDQFATVKKHGLTCAIASNGMPGGFKRGFNNPAHRDDLIKRTLETIDACQSAGVKSVIGFVGMKWENPDDPTSKEIPLAFAREHCIQAIKEVAPAAEKAGVNLCIEHLNSRDGSHPMKGHPGYQGDDLDFVADVVRAVGSPNVKLLFDIYHVQVMHGDVVRRLEQCKDVIGHIHTAGNPGRCELDENQELNYGPAMKKLLEIGYQGYVGHEFIPTRDPRAGLRQAVQICDV